MMKGLRLTFLKILTGWAILREHYGPALLRPAMALGSYAILCFYGFNTLYLALGVAGYILYTLIRAVRAPAPDLKRRAILRRIEQENGLRHRPLTTADQTFPSSEQNTLWRREQTRRRNDITAKAATLRAARAIPAWARQDPYALRYLIAAVILLGIVINGPQESLSRLIPQWPFSASSSTGETGPRLVLRLVPPEYTGLPPFEITDEHIHSVNAPETIPSGTVLEALTTGKFLTYNVNIDGQNIHKKKESGNLYSATQILTAETDRDLTLKIKKTFQTVDIYHIKIVTDKPPKIRIADPPRTTSLGELRVPVQVSDDYGLRKLVLHVSFPEDPSAEDFKISQDVWLATPDSEAASFSPLFDLSGHPKAGEKAVIRIRAVDAAGQWADSKPVTEVTLPVRIFRDPVARRLAEIRKDLLLHTDNETLVNSINGIEHILRRPDMFDFNPVVTMGLRSAISMLAYSFPEPDNIESAALLWDLAVRIDSRGLGDAIQDLRQAAENMQAMIRNPSATSHEIMRAIETYQKALARYLQTLQFDLLRQADMDDLADMLSAMQQGQMNAKPPKTLQDLLQDLREAAMRGDHEKMQDLMSRMQNFMENLNSGIQSMPLGQMAQSAEALRDLQNITSEQENLLHSTENARPEDVQTRGALEQEQSHLRERLESFLNTMGPRLPKDVSDTLGTAGDHMAQASIALGSEGENESLEPAKDAQKMALDALNNAAGKITEQLKQQIRQSIGMSVSLGFSQDRSPLGNQGGQGQGTVSDDRNVTLPQERRERLIDEIADEIRRRASERDRPDPEREYLQRLLERF